MRAGDVESNPGLIALTSYVKRLDSRAKGRARLVAINRAGNNLEENKCRKCKKDAGKKPMTCQKCCGKFHMSHTGETRTAWEKIRKHKRP